jgi:hypothetical protein
VAAITGSAAVSKQDQWSDVDLAFGVSVAADIPAVLSDWTRNMYETHNALDHIDVLFGAWTYRVFILADTLQVDLAFVWETEFRALGPTFQLVFGETNEPRQTAPPQARSIIGMAWLFALHARSSIARQRRWQAEYMVSSVRDHALALACLHRGLPAVHGRGFDLLPVEITTKFVDCLVLRLDVDELSRAFRAAIDILIEQVRSVDEEIALRLQGTLKMLTEIY